MPEVGKLLSSHGCDPTMQVPCWEAEAGRFLVLSKSPSTGQLSSCTLGKGVLLFSLPVALCGPMVWSAPGFPVPHHLLEFAQVHVHCIGDATHA